MAESKRLETIVTIADKDSALKRSGRANGSRMTLEFGTDEYTRACQIAVFCVMKKLRLTVEALDEPKFQPFSFLACVTPLDSAVKFSGRGTGATIQFDIPEEDLTAFKRLSTDCIQRALKLAVEEVD